LLGRADARDRVAHPREAHGCVTGKRNGLACALFEGSEEERGEED